MWLSNSHPATVPVEEVENILRSGDYLLTYMQEKDFEYEEKSPNFCFSILNSCKIFTPFLRSDKVNGLGQRSAEERYLTFGYNELVGREEDPVWKKYLEQFKNPLILLLLCSAIVSVAMRQFDDAASITLAIVIVVTVGFIQEYRSEKTLEKLKKLVPPVCVCIRDGRQVASPQRKCCGDKSNGFQVNFEARFLVPGDLVTLSTGDRIPADLRLVTCLDFAVDESSLTGEPEPIMKSSGVVGRKENLATSELVNQAFMGTMVVAGRATGLVTATADKTQFGQVFQVRGCPCLLTDIQFSFEQF